MKRFLAAIFAPVILYILLSTVNFIYNLLLGEIIQPFSVIFLIIVYIYAFPMFTFFGIPVSILLDKINKGIPWINYTLAGMSVSLALALKSYLSTELVDKLSLYLYPLASFSFFVALIVVGLIFKNIQDDKTTDKERKITKRGMLVYWRIILFIILFFAFITEMISLDIYLAMIVGIIFFSIMPDVILSYKRKQESEES